MIKYTGIVPICPNCNHWTPRAFRIFKTEGDNIKVETWYCGECEKEFNIKYLRIDHEYDPPHGGPVDMEDWLIIENIKKIVSIQYYGEIRAYIYYGEGRDSYNYMMKGTVNQFLEYAKQNGVDNKTMEDWLPEEEPTPTQQ